MNHAISGYNLSSPPIYDFCQSVNTSKKILLRINHFAYFES